MGVRFVSRGPNGAPLRASDYLDGVLDKMPSDVRIKVARQDQELAGYLQAEASLLAERAHRLLLEATMERHAVSPNVEVIGADGNRYKVCSVEPSGETQPRLKCHPQRKDGTYGTKVVWVSPGWRHA